MAVELPLSMSDIFDDYWLSNSNPSNVVESKTVIMVDCCDFGDLVATLVPLPVGVRVQAEVEGLNLGVAP